MVWFENGVPTSSSTAAIRLEAEGNDDFRSMEEVVGRRYQRLDQRKTIPRSCGHRWGKAAAAAVKAFLIQDLEAPPLIGLAKKRRLSFFR